ncbi:hypothetical protein GCM10022234_05300 [Aeromicrobium panaciterrae]|uniref:SDR family NAD(P)-dependent oxidoreductase n=1 Tax=Aeromicrobium panaciterrae TaxID=363861 RepID=UPI0031CE3BBC
MKRVAVIGATGDVGRGVVREAVSRGWEVVAVSRDASRARDLASLGVRIVTADLTDESAATALATELDAAHLDAVVVATNVPSSRTFVLNHQSRDLVDSVARTLLSHHVTMRAFLPLMDAGSVFLGVGGGMADFVVKGYAHASVAQAAQRMLYRTVAAEWLTHPVVLELLVQSMVAGDSNRESAPATWLTDAQIGARICDILDDPGSHEGPILTMAPPV